MPGMQQELQSVRSERSGKLAADVLRLSFNVLLLNLRYMDAALSKLVHVPMLLPDAPLATEGEHLFFDDLSVLRAYKQERARPVRDCLHTVLHCVFAHPFADSKLDGDLWDLACDIAVENVINEMGLRQASCTREHKQQRLLGQLAGEVKHMTAEAIYRYYLDAGFDQAFALVASLYGDMLDPAGLTDSLDAKTHLQEALQKRGEIPSYEEISAEGPPHAPIFTYRVLCGSKELGVGTGRSKQAAQQEAARAALKQIGEKT